MKIKIILGVLFLMIFLLVCKREFPHAPLNEIYLHIEGIVTKSKRPVSGITIELKRSAGIDPTPIVLNKVVTDKDDRYFLKSRGVNCSFGYTWLEVEWNPGEKSHILGTEEVDCTEKLQIIDIEISE